MIRTLLFLALAAMLAAVPPRQSLADDGADECAANHAPPEGFTSLFNGNDLTGWRVPQGDNGHWQATGGVIDYDARSEAEGEKSLFSQREFGDFTLRVDWRIKETPYKNPNVPIILPSGLHKRDENGDEIRMVVPDSDSGIFLRGEGKSQVNIWCWPIGSGEVYGYRMDADMPAEVRAGVTPKINADHDIGQWNTFEITLRGDRLTVVLNGHTVIENAQLPGIPPRGPIALQHHGAMRDGVWTSPPRWCSFGISTSARSNPLESRLQAVVVVDRWAI